MACLVAADSRWHAVKRFAGDQRYRVPIAHLRSPSAELLPPVAEIAEIAMLAFFSRLFDTSGFPPRWECGTAWAQEPAVGWIHILSDTAIFAAYTAIPLMLLYFIFHK